MEVVQKLNKRMPVSAMLDPKTMKYSFVDTCFGTHHPQFGYDADNTLWMSGSGPVAGRAYQPRMRAENDQLRSPDTVTLRGLP